MLEFLKDGDAFEEKYDSEKLKIKTHNVVMVFSNHFQEMEELAPNRWKVFTIRDKQLVEEIFMKDGEDKKLTSEEKKKNLIMKFVKIYVGAPTINIIIVWGWFLNT